MIANRLSKVLASAGVASRRAAEELIFAGRVKVNGKKVLKPQTVVQLPGDYLTVDDQPVRDVEEKVVYILNKPAGYTCSSSPLDGKKIVLDLFEGVSKRLFTVGRLDRDTSGLLIVTNDGEFANTVIHPRHQVIKEYVVKVREEVTEDHLATMRLGVRIDGKLVKPKRVVKIRRGTIKVAVGEGRNREVRVLADMAMLTVLELKRIRIGGLTLGDVPEGSWRTMTENEKKAIFQETAQKNSVKAKDLDYA